MKVAIDTLFEHPDHPSSAIDYLVNAVEALPKAAPGMYFYILVSSRNRHWFETYKAANIELVDCWFSNEIVPLRILAQQTIVPWYLKRLGIDILFSPGNVCPLLGNYCRVLKINTLHHYQTPQMVGRIRSLYRSLAFNLSARRADRVLANTESTRDQISSYMGISKQKISVVWEASFERYQPMPQSLIQDACRRHNIERPFVLFVSTLYPHKNVDTLLHAYASVLNIDRDFPDLIILGRDYNNEAQRLKALASHLGVSSNVHFLGFVDLAELPCFYSGATMFVYPSLDETFGKPLVEAMQCGAPIVASKASAIPEVLGDAGLLVDPRSKEELAATMLRMVKDATLRAELTKKALLRGQVFSWATSAAKTVEVLMETYASCKNMRKLEVTSARTDTVSIDKQVQ